MAFSTERWSDRRLTQKIDGNWIATRAFDVVGYTDENDAISATGVNVGDGHPRNGYIKCTNIALVDDKLTLGKVVATYEITSLEPNPLSPTLRQPKVLWRQGKCSLPVDTDYNGNAILNSAFDAFASNANRNFSVRFLTITRYEPYYDQASATMYTDTVCSASVTFEGITFSAGQMYCLSVAPTGEYQEGCDYIEIKYEFEIRTPSTPNLTALQKRHPFQLRVLDKGQRCQYTDPVLGVTYGSLFLADGTPVSRDVLFDGTGKPIDTSIKVGPGGMSPITRMLPTTVLKDTIKSGGNTVAVFLVFILYPETDFNDIGIS